MAKKSLDDLEEEYGNSEDRDFVDNDENEKESKKSFFSKKKQKQNNKEDKFSTLSQSDIKSLQEKKKRELWAKLAGISVGVLFLIALFIFVFGGEEKVKGSKETVADINDSILAGNGSPNVELLKSDMEGMRAQIEELKALLALRDANQTIDNNNSLLPGEITNEMNSSNIGGLSVPAGGSSTELENAKLKAEIDALKNPSGNTQLGDNSPLSSETPISNNNTQKTTLKKQFKNGKVYEDYAIENIGTSSGLGSQQAIVDSNGTVIATAAVDKKDEITFDIVTGLSKGLLVTGVEAPTYADGSANPKPVLIKFTSSLLTANDARINIKGCNGLGSAIGNMNSKRAEITITRLNCIVEKNGKTYKISEKVQGYVVGEDGSFGLAGRLVDSGAKMVMKQIQVGFLQGVNQAFQTAVQPDVTINSYGTSTAYPTGSQAGQLGASTGASTGLNALVDYYKTMMNGVYPVISIRGGRNIGILWQGGEALKLTGFRIFDSNQKSKSNVLIKKGINYGGY